MPEQETQTKNPTPTASATSAPASATPAPPAPTKQFDVCLVDPHDPSTLHWPKVRCTIVAATLADVPNGDSGPRTQQEKDRAMREIERDRAIEVYKEISGVNTTHLRWDVEEVKLDASGKPTTPPHDLNASTAGGSKPGAWTNHWHHESDAAAPYWKRLAKDHAAAIARGEADGAADEHRAQAARVRRLRADLHAAGLKQGPELHKQD